MPQAMGRRAQNGVARALEALGEAERVARTLGAEALVDGRYEESEQLLDLARSIQCLSAESAPDNQSPAPPPTRRRESATKATTPKKPHAKSAVTFLRREPDVLLKRAWSKKKRAHYVHSIPIEHGVVVLRACLGKGKRGFTVDELTEDREVRSAEVSQYGIYLALGWFKELDWVKPAGPRGRYATSTRVTTKGIPEMVSSAFDSLETE